jgi:LmbE family N-acetylglucosaminyl deacetylase
VRRLGLLVTLLALIVTGWSLPAGTAAPPPDDDGSSRDRVKIHVMGVWAHPDDDTGIIAPCGVWNQLYGIRCGIIMHTRGEGGGNSVGEESGPDLGLRRENEDRASHFRSGTVDIFNVDRVDFFYNTSAPLTEYFWGEEALEQTVRIIRETRPDVMVGFSPSGSGHGNHQVSGRLIWEATRAAADPTAYPGQLTGPDALDTWQVKKITSGGSTQGSGGTNNAPHCTTGFTPGANNPFTVNGVWTGYESPYLWLEGNVQGQEPGTPKLWSQIGREGNRAHPTQARLMEQGLAGPGCTRYAISQAFVPFQPNSSPDAGRDDALFHGATIPDPGGMPLGSMLHASADDFFQVAGQPFEVTVSTRSGEGTLPAGSVSLGLPSGWTSAPSQDIGPITADADSTATFTVTPAAGATAGRYRIAANLSTGDMTGYTDTVMEIVPAVEGRFQRWGNFAEYDEWAAENTWVAGRSGAVQKVGAGESISVPVVVRNWTTSTQDGTVTLSAPAGYALDATSKPYSGLAAGESTTVEFLLTHTDPAAPGGTTANVGITTSYSSPGGSSSETLSLTVVSTTTIAQAAGAPSLDAVESAGEYTGPALDVSRRWEGSNCNPDGTDCGAGSYAKANWHGDDLYLYVEVVDDVQGTPAPPERCWGHWLVDSVEVLLDPRGDSVDTSTTFKSGIMPYTDDPTGSAGNGVNGPCWSRDADNHQGYSSGPLADTVMGGPNAPGMEVVSSALLNAERSHGGGRYALEVKIPLDNLPAAIGPTSTPPTGDAATNDVDPGYLGFNVTPYDSDTQNFVGKTRLAWSPFGSQQSEPYRWGHAYLEGYTPPADRPTTPRDPIIPDTALKGVESPQTVYQSATNGVSISGLAPSDAMTVSSVSLGSTAVTVGLSATEAGTARFFLWSGRHGYIPVFTSSCPGDYDGFTACSPDDGTPPPWSTEGMSGRVLGRETVEVTPGSQQVTLPVDAATFRTLRANGSLLVSFESDSGEVRGWYRPLASSFQPPVRNDPVVNTIDAGDTVPVRLVEQGVQSMAAGSPTLTPVRCGLHAATDAAATVDGQVRGPLFTWRTDPGLAGTCGRLDIRLQDGTTHSAYYRFT